MNLKIELGKLKFCFERGKKTYQAYKDNGCLYLHARILRSNNEEISVILMNIYSSLPEDFRAHVLDLVYHIDVWTSLWDCLEKDIQPRSTDRFVFQNSVNYPIEAELNILKYFESLSNG